MLIRLVSLLLLLSLGACTQPGLIPASADNSTPVAVSSAVQVDYGTAVAHMAAGDFSAAVTQWQALAAQTPADPLVYANMALSYYHLQKYEQGLQVLADFTQVSDTASRLHSAAPDTPHPAMADTCATFKVAALLQRQQGLFQHAAQSYQQAAECAPEDADIPYNLGILYDLYLQDLEQALQQYRRALELLPDNEQLTRWVTDVERRLSRQLAGGNS